MTAKEALQTLNSPTINKHQQEQVANTIRAMLVEIEILKLELSKKVDNSVNN